MFVIIIIHSGWLSLISFSCKICRREMRFLGCVLKGQISKGRIFERPNLRKVEWLIRHNFWKAECIGEWFKKPNDLKGRTSVVRKSITSIGWNNLMTKSPNFSFKIISGEKSQLFVEFRKIEILIFHVRQSIVRLIATTTCL